MPKAQAKYVVIARDPRIDRNRFFKGVGRLLPALLGTMRLGRLEERQIRSGIDLQSFGSILQRFTGLVHAVGVGSDIHVRRSECSPGGLAKFDRLLIARDCLVVQA